MQDIHWHLFLYSLYFHFSQSVEMKPADNKATLKLGVSLSANLTVSG